MRRTEEIAVARSDTGADTPKTLLCWRLYSVHIACTAVIYSPIFYGLRLPLHPTVVPAAFALPMQVHFILFTGLSTIYGPSFATTY